MPTLPVTPMSSPPISGPSENPSDHVIDPRAFAAGSRCSGTSRGMMDWRAGVPTAKNDDCAATIA